MALNVDEKSRRSLHDLVARATGGDAHARTAIEELVMSLNRSGAAEDVGQALQVLQVLGPEGLHATIVARLQENDYRAQQQPLIG
jgi:hypothetical protein